MQRDAAAAVACAVRNGGRERQSGDSGWLQQDFLSRGLHSIPFLCSLPLSALRRLVRADQHSFDGWRLSAADERLSAEEQCGCAKAIDLRSRSNLLPCCVNRCVCMCECV